MAAKESGADIVKFQTFKTDNCISTTPIVPYQSKGKDLKTQYELVKDLELSFEEFIILKELSDKIGIEFCQQGLIFKV